MERKGGNPVALFTHKAVPWDGIYDIIAISIAAGAIISILIQTSLACLQYNYCVI